MKEVGLFFISIQSLFRVEMNNGSVGFKSIRVTVSVVEDGLFITRKTSAYM